MENRSPESFKPLTISAEDLPALRDRLARQEELTSYAAERAKLLLGCYRTGEANDPGTYVAAVTAILARYPEQVITIVTHPATGLPSKSGWLPTVKEVADACNEAFEPIKQNEARLKRVAEQLAMRERHERGEKPTLEELQAKYGKDWGLTPLEKPSRSQKAAPGWDEIVAMYQAEPGRITHLADALPRLRMERSADVEA